MQEHEFSHEQPSEDAVDNPFLQQLLGVLPNSEQQAFCLFLEKWPDSDLDWLRSNWPQQLQFDAAVPMAQWQAETGAAGSANIATVNQMMALAAYCCTRLTNITGSDFTDNLTGLQ
ncbi:hypothetical protein F1728_19625 [Gimesia benthica]|uniref:Uncharacterized protein n=2 Tax=Gimesia TaxID=1649453 RepID=A0A6I6AH91_9PLAN|nr:hypothetical protein [Gimesia benthica]QGQ24760.1 hypothetical protein F1728_19625 [Gimesia benthica]HCO22320.1 hypothetical protein [Gimesia maris]